MKETFRIVPEKTANSVRAYQLGYGDVISVNGKLLQYGNEIFYEVVEEAGYDCFDGIIVRAIKYVKTGKTFTLEQVSELANGGN